MYNLLRAGSFLKTASNFRILPSDTSYFVLLLIFIILLFSDIDTGFHIQPVVTEQVSSLEDDSHSGRKKFACP
jgi:hypothetical protein